MSSDLSSGPVQVVAGQEPADRFLPWQMPNGWPVIDLQTEEVAIPKTCWDAETAASVAGALRTFPAYAITLTWTSIAERPEEGKA